MFTESFIKPGKSLRAQALAFPVSVVLHAGIILGLIIVPLIRNGELPRLEAIGTLLVPPPPAPALPAAGRPRPADAGRVSRIRPASARIAPANARLVAPVVIPDEISEETLLGSGNWSDLVGIDNGPSGLPVDDFIGRIIQPEPDADVALNTPSVVAVVKPPRLVKRVDPVYPEIARAARVSGAVKLVAVTDVYGRVREAHVVESISLLDESALEAVRQWIYEPLVVNGRPRAVAFEVTVRFVLN